MKTKVFCYDSKFVVNDFEFPKNISFNDFDFVKTIIRNESEMIAYLIKHWGGEQDDYEIIYK